MLDLTGDAPRIVEQVETGRVYLDGTVLIGAMDGVVRDRIRMAMRGKVAVSVIIDERGRPLGGAWVETTGLPDNPKMRDGLEGALEAEVGRVLAAGQAGGARRRRGARGADPARGLADLQRRGRQEAGLHGDDQPAGGVRLRSAARRPSTAPRSPRTAGSA